MIRPGTAPTLDAPDTPDTALSDPPTIWGLTPAKLHDRFWAARGVQVVRPGEKSEIVRGAELFLLTDARLLVTFKLRALIEHLSWINPDLLWIRLRDQREHGYRERAVSDASGRFVRFERLYGGQEDAGLARVALTPDPEIARMWQSAADARSGWRGLRRCIPRSRRSVVTVRGRVYLREADREMMQLVRDLIEKWKSPDTTIDRAMKLRPGVWGDVDAQVDKSVQFSGPAWVGAGRRLCDSQSVTGPAVLWDTPGARPAIEEVRWENLEPNPAMVAPVKARTTRFDRGAKRVFDVLFALVALVVLAPVFPVVMVAIWIEDGWPCFFAHKRETRGGQVFPCLKFRSMRRDADEIKARISQQNQVDGPQFFIENDPRITEVGRFIRKYHIDELPQFFNVLAGHMSIVGPRPSPFEENQFCPPWREARLSVRPGLTGLWQVCRTRQQGMDFQEWIKYDLEYVENASFKLDLWIIWKTILLLVSGS